MSNESKTRNYFVSLPHLVMAVIGMVFLLDTYEELKDDFQKVWICNLIWSCAYLYPIANNLLGTCCFYIQDPPNAFTLSAMVAFGMWIWNWVIIASDDWGALRKDYRPITDLIWSFQIISIFINGVGVTLADTTKDHLPQ